ncbi:MAG: SET domain-containing protein [Anaerolineae bacterium]
MKTGLSVASCELGRGLFAGRPYRPGELILVLRGLRYDQGDPIHLSALGANLLQTGPRSYILPLPPGVFVNHSCNPNAGVHRNRRLIAIRAIEPGQEIRFDYSTTMDEDFWTMDCRCGENTCRRVIGDFKYLPLDLQAHYLELGVVPKFIAKKMVRA